MRDSASTRDALPPEWEEWAAGADGASFSTRRGWIESLSGNGAGHLVLFEARREGRLAGALPAFVTRRFGRRWLHSMPFGTYGGPLVARGERDAGDVRRELIAACMDWRRAERIAGGEVVVPPASAEAAADSPPDPHWLECGARAHPGIAHRVDLGPSIASLEAGLRRETRKGFRHAQRAGVTVAREPQAIAEVHGLYARQARQWGVRRPLPLGLLRALVEHPSRFAELWVARAGSEVHAGILALSGGGETFLWWSGAAEAARASLAYPYLIWGIAAAAAERGERRLNLGASAGNPALHRFKESLGAAPYPYWTYSLPPAAGDWASRAIAWARERRRRP